MGVFPYILMGSFSHFLNKTGKESAAVWVPPPPSMDANLSLLLDRGVSETYSP